MYIYSDYMMMLSMSFLLHHYRHYHNSPTSYNHRQKYIINIRTTMDYDFTIASIINYKGYHHLRLKGSQGCKVVIVIKLYLNLSVQILIVIVVPVNHWELILILHYIMYYYYFSIWNGYKKHIFNQHQRWCNHHHHSIHLQWLMWPVVIQGI